MLKSKKGNVIIIVAAVFVILAFALGSFLKTTLDRRYSTQKLGDTLYAREFAKSLAILTIDYITINIHLFTMLHTKYFFGNAFLVFLKNKLHS